MLASRLHPPSLPSLNDRSTPWRAPSRLRRPSTAGPSPWRASPTCTARCALLQRCAGRNERMADCAALPSTAPAHLPPSLQLSPLSHTQPPRSTHCSARLLRRSRARRWTRRSWPSAYGATATSTPPPAPLPSGPWAAASARLSPSCSSRCTRSTRRWVTQESICCAAVNAPGASALGRGAPRHATLPHSPTAPLVSTPSQILGEDERSVRAVMDEFGVSLRPASYGMDVKPLIKEACW